MALSTEYDVTIQPAGGTETGYLLERDEKGAPIWSWRYRPLFAPRYPSGELHYGDKNPNEELVLKIDSFDGGFGASLPASNQGNMYQEASGVYAAARGQISLDSAVSDPYPVFLRNGTFDSNITNWRTVLGTLSHGTSYQRTGSGHANYTHTADIGGGLTRTTIEQIVRTTGVVTGSSPQSGSVTFSIWVRGASGVTSVLRPYIETVAETTATFGADVTVTTSWQKLTVTGVIHSGSADTLRVGVRPTATGGSVGYVADDVLHFDDADVSWGTTTPLAVATTGGKLYMAVGDKTGVTDGGGVFELDTTNLFWVPMVVNSGTLFTSMVAYDGDLFVAQGATSDSGTEAAYFYGAANTWVTCTISGTGKNARHFAVVRNTLWKANEDNATPNEVFSSTNPRSGGSWSTAYSVGNVDYPINLLVSLNDGLLVGRSDGLWNYDRTGNAFTDDLPEYQYAPDSSNFEHGFVHHGWLYTVTRRGLVRYDRTTFEHVTRDIVCNTLLADFGGRIRAMGTDGEWLYILQDTPESDTAVTKATWLLALDDTPQANRVRDANVTHIAIHTRHELVLGDLYAMYSFGDFLYVAGRHYDAGLTAYRTQSRRMALPIRHRVPARDLTPALATEGTLITAWYDFNLPDMDKAFLKATIDLENNTSNRTVKLEYEKDSDATWRVLGTTSDTSKQVTFNFEDISGAANRIAKRIRFRFTLATNDATESPFALPLTVHAIAAPSDGRLKEFGFTVRAGAGLETLAAYQDLIQLDTATTLEAYMVQQWPVVLREDLAGDGTAVAYNVQILSVQKRYITRKIPDVGEEVPDIVYDVAAQEVDVD
jgi:hypothetical protein